MAEVVRQTPTLWTAKTEKNNEISVRANTDQDLGRTTIRRDNGKLVFVQVFNISFSPRLTLNDEELQRLQEDLQKEAEFRELTKPTVIFMRNPSVDWPGLRFNELESVVTLLASRLSF